MKYYVSFYHRVISTDHEACFDCDSHVYMEEISKEEAMKLASEQTKDWTWEYHLHSSCPKGLRS